MMNYPVKHNISLAILLFCLWLGLSGQLNVLMLSLGLASTLFVVDFSHRMVTIDREMYPAHLTPLLLRFWLFLTREVIAANIDVVKRIFKPGKNISPQLYLCAYIFSRHKNTFYDIDIGSNDFTGQK